MQPSESHVFFRLRTYLPTVVIGLFIAFFTDHVLTGPHGLLSAPQRHAALAAREAALARLHDQRMALEIRARLLRNDYLSKDLLEERAHDVLGFVGPSDYVIQETPTRG